MSRIVSRLCGTENLTKVCFETYSVRCIHNAYFLFKLALFKTLSIKVGGKQFLRDFQLKNMPLLCRQGAGGRIIVLSLEIGIIYFLEFPK